MKWARCSTLTESIWIRWSRRSTRRKWRMSVAPPGRGSAKPCAASVTRRACATLSVSGRAIDEQVKAGVRQKRERAILDVRKCGQDVTAVAVLLPELRHTADL